MKMNVCSAVHEGANYLEVIEARGKNKIQNSTNLSSICIMCVPAKRIVSSANTHTHTHFMRGGFGIYM